MTTVNGTYTACGSDLALTFTCTGPNCSILDGYPGTTCATSGGVLTCHNDITCSGKSNYTSSFSFSQPEARVTSEETILLTDICEEIVFTSDGTQGGRKAQRDDIPGCDPVIIVNPPASNSSTTSIPAGPSTTTSPASSKKYSNATTSSVETSTIRSTKVYTITSCPPTVPNCPIGSVTTEVQTIYSTYCPETGSGPQATPTYHGEPGSPGSPDSPGGGGTKALTTAKSGPTSTVVQVSGVSRSARIPTWSFFWCGLIIMFSLFSGATALSGPGRTGDLSAVDAIRARDGDHAVYGPGRTGDGLSTDPLKVRDDADRSVHGPGRTGDVSSADSLKVRDDADHTVYGPGRTGDAPSTNALKARHDVLGMSPVATSVLDKRGLFQDFEQAAGAIIAYYEDKIPASDLADTLVASLESAVCDFTSSKLLTAGAAGLVDAAFGVEYVATCMGLINDLVIVTAPEIELVPGGALLLNFAAKQLCNKMLQMIFHIPDVVEDICKAPKPCTKNFLTDANNCGRCGNVCSTGVCQSGACTSDSCTGQTCDTFTDCGPGQPCVCASTTEGTGFCVNGNTACANLADCNASADCGAGEICAYQTCCSRNVCVGATFCGGSKSSPARMLRRTFENATIADPGIWVP